MHGTIFNIQRFSTFDGPGIRTVVFLKGCPLRCLWCHNPEGLSQRPQIMYDGARCIACGGCIAVCEKNLHIIENGIHTFLREGCTACGKCAEVCCSQALSLAGKSMSVEEVLYEVKKDLPFYKESGGGLTISGGEPLFQPDFTLALLKKAKEDGIHTCIETSGFGDSEKLTEIAKYTDRFLFDYKATGDDRHRELCRVSQEIILKNLALINSLGIDTVLSCPIVPSQNGTNEHIEAIARVAKEHDCVLEVQLEPYHSLGTSKADRLGLDGYYNGCEPSKSELDDYCEKISALSGKKARVS